MDRVWAGAVVAILGGGPSLTREQIDICRDTTTTIVINSSVYAAPWADLLYFCDAKWYRWNEAAVRDFRGMRVTLENEKLRDELPDLVCMRNDSKGSSERREGFCSDPSGLRTGGNSGYQALHLAVHMGARRILLLGYDMRPGPGGRMHHYPEHPTPTNPDAVRFWAPRFRSLIEPLARLGVEVLNCTPGSLIDCFPRVDLLEALT